MKSGNNTGVVIETFGASETAAAHLDVLRALQALNEQAMAKIGVSEGDVI
jgi:hypothetical protein